jgi:gas vesicle protein
MTVKEAQRRTADVLGRTGGTIGQGLDKAREKAREKAGRGVVVVRAKAAEGVGTAREKAGPRLERAAKVTGRRLRMARDRAGKGLGARRARAGKTIKGTRRTVGFWIAGEKPKSRARRIGAGIAIGAAGAAAAFFLDPVSGKRRRRVAKDWTVARFRDLSQQGGRVGRSIAARSAGTIQSIRHRRDAGLPENDQVLAHKVQSELFQKIDLSSGQIVINAEEGLVILRGQVEQADDIAAIEMQVRRIEGVRDVSNLLHLPGQPAPTQR